MSSPHSQDISRWLPNDILLDIMEISSKSDQVSLCLVSKLFHALCLPILNRTVHLNYCASSIAFCSALIVDPTRAEAVRSLTVVEFSSPWYGEVSLVKRTVNGAHSATGIGLRGRGAARC